MQRLFPSQWKTLGLAAPASMPDPDALKRSQEFLRSQGIQILAGFDPEEKDPLTYLSASAQCRLQHLNRLIRDPGVDAIYCIRGGFGSIHLLEGIDFDTLKKRNLPLIGYSDITSLHMAMLRKKAGIPISACMALKLEEESDASPDFSENFRRTMALGAFESSIFQQKKRKYVSGFSWTALSQLTALNQAAHTAEKVEGKLICGNVTVMTSLCGTAFFPSCRNRILLLEDVGEMTRRLDASLYQLFLNGIFNRCKAVILGDFTDCGKGKTGELEIMLKNFASMLNCPVFGGLHFGHCRGSLSFVQEETLRLEKGKLFCRTPQEQLLSAERS